jgi:hypothetical protein
MCDQDWRAEAARVWFRYFLRRFLVDEHRSALVGGIRGTQSIAIGSATTSVLELTAVFSHYSC